METVLESFEDLLISGVQAQVKLSKAMVDKDLSIDFYVDGGRICSSILLRNRDRGGTTFDSIYMRHPDGGTTKKKLSFARLVSTIEACCRNREGGSN